MKKIALVLFSLVAAFGLFSCGSTATMDLSAKKQAEIKISLLFLFRRYNEDVRSAHE